MEKKLFTWSAKNYSDLPWRRNRTLYKTLVSEIMLQQTTVQTVINHFDKFLLKYPTIQKLAKTSEQEICMAWKGLGYYRRARNLRLAAIDICKIYNGEIPTDFSSLVKISGIGTYTANALIAIGYNKRALALDANLERVLSRYIFVEDEKGAKLQKEIYRMFDNDEIFSSKTKIDFRMLNEALMDLGRVYCQANKVDCILCPLNKNCKSLQEGKPLSLPYISQAKKVKEKHELSLLRVIVKDKKKIITIKRNKGEWLEGQVECPTFILSTTDKKLKQYPKIGKSKVSITGLKKIKSTITKYKIQNYILEMSKKEFANFIDQENFQTSLLNIKKTNFSSTTLKILKQIGIES